MAGFGALNPFPRRIGGAPSETERAYTALREAVGTGGSAPDDSGIEGLWRRSKAKGLAAATSALRRAVLQAWPITATDLIPSYERTLGIIPPTGATMVARRAEVVSRWIAQLSATIPALTEQLTAIDSRVSILSIDPALFTTTVHGRAFGDGVEPFGGAGHTDYPNYSDAFILRVRFATGYTGALNAADARIRERLREVLRSRLPSWVDFTITTSSGFVLGVSRLDITGLTDG